MFSLIENNATRWGRPTDRRPANLHLQLHCTQQALLLRPVTFFFPKKNNRLSNRIKKKILFTLKFQGTNCIYTQSVMKLSTCQLTHSAISSYDGNKKYIKWALKSWKIQIKSRNHSTFILLRCTTTLLKFRKINGHTMDTAIYMLFRDFNVNSEVTR